MAFRQPPSVLAYEDVQHTARNDRLTTGAAFTPGPDPLSTRSGALVGPPGANGTVSLPDQDTVRLGPGIFVMQGRVDATQGQYVAINDADYDQALNVEQHASQFRRVAVVTVVLDSVMAGLDPQPVLDEGTGEPVLDPDTSEPLLGFGQPTNLADVVLVPGELSPAAPGFDPVVDAGDYQAWAVLGWVNVPPAGQIISYTPNPLAVVGSRTGIHPMLAGDDADGSHLHAYRHNPDEGLQYWDGGAWRSVFTREHLGDRIRLTSQSLADAGSTLHPLQLGSPDGLNLVADVYKIMVREAGAVVPLHLVRPILSPADAWNVLDPATPGGALVTKDALSAFSARTTAERLRLTSTSGVTVDDAGAHALQIGPDSGYNVRFDPRTIKAVNNKQPSNLLLDRPVAAPGGFVLDAETTPGNAYVTKDHVKRAVRNGAWTSHGPAGGWAGIGAEGGVKYKLVGNVVFWRIAVDRTGAGTWAADAVVLTVPDELRCSIPQTFTAHWGAAVYELRLNSTGPLLVKRAGSGGLVTSFSYPVD